MFVLQTRGMLVRNRRWLRDHRICVWSSLFWIYIDGKNMKMCGLLVYWVIALNFIMKYQNESFGEMSHMRKKAPFSNDKNNNEEKCSKVLSMVRRTQRPIPITCFLIPYPLIRLLMSNILLALYKALHYSFLHFIEPFCARWSLSWYLLSSEKIGAQLQEDCTIARLHASSGLSQVITILVMRHSSDIKK